MHTTACQFILIKRVNHLNSPMILFEKSFLFFCSFFYIFCHSMSLLWLPSEQRSESKLFMLCYVVIMIIIKSVYYYLREKTLEKISTSQTFFTVTPIFCRHPSVQSTILSHKYIGQYSFYYQVPTPCFCPSCYLCQFFQIFLENHSLFKNLFIFLKFCCSEICVSLYTSGYSVKCNINVSSL